jgi:hypothetical protein
MKLEFVASIGFDGNIHLVPKDDRCDRREFVAEVVDRLNAFEPGGEVERLRAALAAVDWQEVMTDMGAACQEFCIGACSCSDRIETVREVAALAAKVGDA